jgi:poly-gamma-glutamate synthesis protein (capsule biosynthesis protein)
VACFSDRQPAEQTQPTEQTTQPTETTVPPESRIIAATARFTVTGDLLMHLPVIESCWNSEKGDWVFDPIFTYVTPYIQKADYAVANLETTLRGENDTYPYQGNPLFNCPDGIAPAAKAAGFDMLLTGNNHCYDTRVEGVSRTLEVVEQAGLESLGTQKSKDDPDYKVIEVNGIKVGMTAYTFETSDGLPDVPSINAIRCRSNVLGMINSYDGGQLKKFYAEIGAQFDAMREEGAEAIVVYMHWGDEYRLEPTSHQKKIAQKLCDMGVDVIVGGHPHVVEPVDLLTSTEDENHKTLIIYSTGNAVSNQRIGEMDMKSGHTEDGILFHFTLVRYIDGTVALLETSCTPTWVHMEGYQQRYTILPLEYRLMDQWQEAYRLDEDTFNACVNSYRRTMLLVYDGLEKAQSWFDEQLAAKFALLG